jgi:hypothetical protein
MNTQIHSSGSSSVKAFACAVAALALTIVSSWTFVQSTAVARVGGEPPATVSAALRVVAQFGSHLG